MFHFKALLTCTLLISLFTAAPNASAQSSSGSNASGDFFKRAERRQSQRWTLQEWLAQKDRNRMMDMWLSMNSPSPYELMLGASYNSYQSESSALPNSSSQFQSYQGVFSAYAQFVGLSAEYENNTQEGFNDLSGIFNLRLLGNSIQSSYLTLHYGLRTRTQSSPQLTLRQQFAQASLQIYLIKHFGVDGLYRYYLPMDEDSLGKVQANLSEAGIFIDFKNFRVFGSWYNEAQNSNLNNTLTETTRSGLRSGLKIFF